jgi:hypothetical protein
MQLIAIDWIILGVYFVFVLGIGYAIYAFSASRRKRRGIHAPRHSAALCLLR